MSKLKNPRRCEKNEAVASLNSLRCSTRKVGLVTGLIQGKTAGEALRLLTFCRKRAADDIKKLLLSAIANAENNHNLNIDELRVKTVSVGKDFVIKRFRPRAKGRACGIIKEFSRVTLVLEEVKGAA
jgi:large subunit ribosomal protein L22